MTPLEKRLEELSSRPESVQWLWVDKNYPKKRYEHGFDIRVSTWAVVDHETERLRSYYKSEWRAFLGAHRLNRAEEDLWFLE